MQGIKAVQTFVTPEIGEEFTYENLSNTVLTGVVKSYLQPDVREFVRNKLEEQIGKRDAKGILFKPDSTLSQEIIYSPELKEFIMKHFKRLNNGENVIDSGYLGSTKNLALSLGHVDIYINIIYIPREELNQLIN